MKTYYKIDSSQLQNILNKVTSEKTTFTQGSYKNFSNGYLSSCNDSDIQRIKRHLEELYKIINSGYEKIINWMGDYTQDVKNLENSLKTGESNVVDPLTDEYLNNFVENLKNDVKNSTDLNFDSNIQSYSAEPPSIANDGVDLTEANGVDITEYKKLLESLKGEYSKKLEELRAKREELKNSGITSGKEFDELNKEILDYKTQVDLLEDSLNEIERNIKITNYDMYYEQTEFKMFINNYDVEKLIKEYDEKYITAPMDLYQAYDILALAEYAMEYQGADVDKGDNNISNLKIGKVENEISSFDFYKYTTDKQKAIYHYLRQKVNVAAADEYASLIIPDINAMIVQDREEAAKLKLKKYEDIRSSEEFKNFEKNYDVDALYKYWDTNNSPGWEVDMVTVAEYNLKHPNSDGTVPTLGTYKYGEIDLDPYQFYAATTDEERMMYHYLYQKYGSDKANEYIVDIQDNINSRLGTSYALEFINSLDLNDEDEIASSLSNIFSTTTEGLGDGIKSFTDGIRNSFKNNKALTPEEYKKAIIIQYLEKNKLLKYTYVISNGIGNLIPAIVGSIVLSGMGATLISEALTSNRIGSMLMTLSARGNAKHQALVKGASTIAANVYGLLKGASVTLAGKILEGFEGISTEYSLLKTALATGGKSFISEYVDWGLRAVVLGEVTDITNLTESAFKSLLVGAISGGITKGNNPKLEFIYNNQRITMSINHMLSKMKEGGKSGTDILIEAASSSCEVAEMMNIYKDQTGMTDQQVNDKIKEMGTEEFSKMVFKTYVIKKDNTV